MMKKYFPLAITVGILVTVGFLFGQTPGHDFGPAPADAAYNANAPHMKGWVWSSNVGWISLSCEDRGVCGTSPYTVEIVPSGTPGVNNLDGYAWSNNAGWISFKRATAGNPPVAPYNGGAGPIAQMNGNALLGWARATAASGGSGWDGWIRLADASAPAGAYGVTKNSSNYLEGYVWGGDVVGWAQFSQAFGSQVVTPFDMSVAVTPSVTATRGQFADVNFSSTLLSGVAQNVTYTINGALPAGMSFNPSTWTCQPSSASCPTSFRVLTTSATPTGTYNFQLVPSPTTPSTPGPIPFSVIVSAAPTTCSFTIRNPQPAVSIAPGGSQVVTFDVQEDPGYSCGTVALTSVAPSGLSATNPADCDPTCSSSVTITASSSATPGTYSVTINGSSGGFANELQIPVDITGGCAGTCGTDGDFTIRHSPLDNGENCPSGTIVGWGGGPCTGAHAVNGTHFVRDIQIGGTVGSTESSNTILTIYPTGAFNSSVTVSIDSVMEDTGTDGVGDVAVATSLFNYKFARLTRATYTILPAQFGSTLFQVQLASSDVEGNAGRYVVRLRARGTAVQGGTPVTVDRYTYVLVVVGANTQGFVGGTGGPGGET